MTIRKRLTLSFGAILFLFGLNLAIYFYSNSKRALAVQELRHTIQSQILAAGIKENLSNLQKQVQLMSNIAVDQGSSGLDSDEVEKFSTQLEDIAKQIRELREGSEDAIRAQVEDFYNTYQHLGKSWRIFYQNFGRDQAKAITELAMNGDALSQRVMQQLEQLQDQEKKLVVRANESFDQVAQFTDWLTILMFVISTIIAVAVAHVLSYHLVRGLLALKHGADAIGTGHLEHRIALDSRDELGDLANTFNNMTGGLLSARSQLLEANQALEQRHSEVEREKQVSESLLRNILPEEVARELRERGEVEPKYYEDVTILFTDFVGFSLSTEKLAAEDLVSKLHSYFTTFDHVINRYGLEKLKTIGDSYMCVGGMPVRTPSHPVDAVMAALELVKAVTELASDDDESPWSVRVGIHTGPVIAGVVGIQKFAFDVWGDSVNFSSRMESSGAPNRINLSGQTYTRVKDFFDCEHRGKVLTKEKREFDMYFVNGVLPQLIDGSKKTPPPAFSRRYRIYFQKDPPAFPAFLLETAVAAPIRIDRRAQS